LEKISALNTEGRVVSEKDLALLRRAAELFKLYGSDRDIPHLLPSIVSAADADDRIGVCSRLFGLSEPHNYPDLLNAISASGATMFFATGYGDKCFYSIDCRNWFAKALGRTIDLNGIATDGRTVVAVGEDKQILYAEGTGDWTEATFVGEVFDIGEVPEIEFGDRVVTERSAQYDAFYTTFTECAYGGGRFVAVGRCPGLIFQSGDGGKTWERATLPNDYGVFNCVTYGGPDNAEKFVAAGGDGVYSGKVHILSSGDGLNWTEVLSRPAINDYDIDGVEYGDGKFITVELHGRAFYSADGMTWSETKVPQMSKILYGNGRFVGGREGVYSSQTGISDWIQVQGLPSESFYSYDHAGIAFGGGKFVAISDSQKVFTSLDGQTWSQSGSVNGAVSGFSVVGLEVKMLDLYLAEAGKLFGLRGEQMASIPDLIGYALAAASYSGELSSAVQLFDPSLPATYPALLDSIIDSGGAEKLRRALDLFDPDLPATYPALLSSIVSSGVLVAGGDEEKIRYSLDGGTSWIPATFLTDGVSLGNWANSMCAMVYGDNGRFVAINDEGFFYSDDGINWSKSSSANSNYYYGCVSARGKFVATSPSIPQITYSADNGMTWSFVELSEDLTDAQLWKIAYGGAEMRRNFGGTVTQRFVAVGYDTSANADLIAYSEDGVSWTRANFEATPDNVLLGIVWGNSRFAAVGGNRIHYSTDGINWDLSSFTPTKDWCGITYGNGVYVAGCAGRSMYWSSDDLDTWTQITSLPSYCYYFNYGDCSNITYDGSKFVAVPYSSADYDGVYSSSDGKNWDFLSTIDDSMYYYCVAAKPSALQLAMHGAVKNLGCEQTYPAVLKTVDGLSAGLANAATHLGLPEDGQTVPAVIGAVAELNLDSFAALFNSAATIPAIISAADGINDNLVEAIRALAPDYDGPFTIQTLINLAKAHEPQEIEIL
jgi:photosystem II stability/assembly factor-like uncharacterized protein